MNKTLQVLILSTFLFSGSAIGAEPAAKARSKWLPDNASIGLGLQQRPEWLGSAHHKTELVPYFDLQWGERIELSSEDGLSIDLIDGKKWHGGLIGTLMWGRSTHDLGDLANKVHTLTNTEQAGIYIEYEWFRGLDAGLRLSHDIQGTGAAYASSYLEVGLPAPGDVEHGFRFSVNAMNKSAMRRYFGVSASEATALGTSAWAPRAGASRIALTYGATIPLSTHTGLNLTAEWGKLIGDAGDSPLVRNAGSATQRSYQLSLFYKF